MEKKIEKKQLKYKHDRLKDEWRAWILVAEDKRQTGLGKNPETGAITGPDHWWEAMIARNNHVAKFRDQGLEHEDLMDGVFRNVTAMGNDAIFPCEGIEEITEGSGESNGMRVHGGSFPQSREQYQTPVGKGKDPTRQTSTVGGSYSSRKHKFSDAHEAMSASFAESVDCFKSTPSIVINQSGKWGIDNAIEKLDTLPFFEVEGQNVQFHSWACHLFERQQHKIDIFCQQKNLINAIQWLRDEHTLAEERCFSQGKLLHALLAIVVDFKFGHGSSSNPCGGFCNEGTEDGGKYGESEPDEEDPMVSDESLLLEDEDDVPEHVACIVYEKDVQYNEMLKNYALQYVPIQIQRIPYHTSTHNGFDWVMLVLTCPNPRRCPENFSMTIEVFVKLCDELVNKYDFHTTRRHAIRIFESLAMFLCILRGASLKLVGELLNRGQASCSRQINKVLLCVTIMAKHEIQPHMNHPHSYLSHRPQYRHFMDCIGAMDGTHVLCNPPSKDAKKYFGRKGGHTMNIIAICDFDLCFTFALAGWEESMHDYHVFRECVYGRGRNMFPHPPVGKYYLVDGGYPNGNGYLSPYKGYMYHLEDFRRGRKRHMNLYKYSNRWHSSLRSAIERAFGVWKNRWRMMKETSTYLVRIHKLFVIASMAIHKFIRRNSLHDEGFAEVIGKDDKYVYEDLPDIDPNFAAQEDIEGLIYPPTTNTSDMEIVWHGIMTALQHDREVSGQPQCRRRT
ncbi:hypothetical protein RHGRI_012840 [Rhododendron griersonianum]|uniref:DDE Tnp4 domain-containing protein n=1 Tax=Rhododendron griersonianum TaxID=479676 RepID=A0AAV6K3H7_9ERIC|nr:hypothetical protein RHGRI_012840 [Rhododendron griersonianum]